MIFPHSTVNRDVIWKRLRQTFTDITTLWCSWRIEMWMEHLLNQTAWVKIHSDPGEFKRQFSEYLVHTCGFDSTPQIACNFLNIKFIHAIFWRQNLNKWFAFPSILIRAESNLSSWFTFCTSKKSSTCVIHPKGSLPSKVGSSTLFVQGLSISPLFFKFCCHAPIFPLHYHHCGLSLSLLLRISLLSWIPEGVLWFLSYLADCP